jgi:multidrug resistance efflux pump
MSNEDVKAAEIKVEAARAKLTASLQEVSRQFAPHRLMEEVWEKAKDKGADLAEDAGDAVRRRPSSSPGVVAWNASYSARSKLMDIAGK